MIRHTSKQHLSTLTKEYALIVAGGKGLRFGSSMPKQFLGLNGKPILLHTINAFVRYSSNIQIVLVLPESEISIWEELALAHKFDHPLTMAKGGESRFQSVRNGLAVIPDDAVVAIHDGVRPLVTAAVIRDSFTLARIHGSAVASVPLKESLRIVHGPENKETKSVDRSLYRSIQTPQTFQSAIIKKAYTIDEDPSLTDDASVAERAGFAIHLFEGRYDNIKITTPGDLLVAEALLSQTGGL